MTKNSILIKYQKNQIVQGDFFKVLVGLRFFLHIAKISLILYEFYFEDIAKISQIVGPLGHTISIKKWHTVFFSK